MRSRSLISPWLVSCLVTLALLVPLLPAQAEPTPTIATDAATYEVGDPITVSWNDAPGNALDWVGLYPSSVEEPSGNPPSTLWNYLDGAGGDEVVTDGSITWDADDSGETGTWPLPAGEYRVFLLADDGYEILASTQIEVTGEASGPPGADMPPEEEWPANPQDPSLDGDVTSLRVMTYNLWLGGDQVGFDYIVDGVEAADADVVGLQEAGGGAVERLADELGWDHWIDEEDWGAIVSRYPISSGSSSAYHWLELGDDERAVISNVHLRAYPYGPYDLRDGFGLDHVLDNAQHHLVQMDQRLTELTALADAGFPVVLTGDFNVPSHLDWGTDAIEARVAQGEEFLEPIGWPLSIALAEAGFRDTFRTARPDPVGVPGYTWTPGYPPPYGDEPAELTEDEVHDRIDKIYVGGPVATVDSQVVGENHPITDIVSQPWGTDHRAVVSELELATSTDAAEPGLDVARRVLRADQPLEVSFEGAPGNATDWIGVYERGERPGTDTPSLLWQYVGGGQTPTLPLPAGSVRFDGDADAGEAGEWPLPAGEYVVFLLEDDGYEVLDEARVKVIDPPGPPAHAPAIGLR